MDEEWLTESIEKYRKDVAEKLLAGEALWLTISEVVVLKLGFSREWIRRLLNDNDKFEKRQKGKAFEFRITRENMGRLDKDNVLQLREEAVNVVDDADMMEALAEPQPAAEKLPQPAVTEQTPKPAAVETPTTRLTEPVAKAANKSELCTLDYALRKLKAANPFYNSENIGEFLQIRQAVRRGELEELEQYMKGKRFFSQLNANVKNRILSDVNKEREHSLSLDDVVEQVRRGAVKQFKGHDMVVLSDDDIISMINAGRWMAAEEIKKAGSRFETAEIKSMLASQPEVYKTREYNKTQIGYITPENTVRLGIEEKIVVKVLGKDEIFYPGRTYAKEDVAKLLRQIHPAVFSDAIINDLYRLMQGKGAGLIKLLREVGGGIITPDSTSARQRLQSLFGCSEEELSDILSAPQYKRFLHNFGDVKKSFLLKDELEELRALVAESRKSTRAPDQPAAKYGNNNNEREATDMQRELAKYHSTLTQMGVMPTGTMYDDLKGKRILDETTFENMKKSYEAFIAAMQGCQYFDFDKVFSKSGLGDGEISGRIGKLIEEGAVKEIKPVIHGYSGRFLVLVRGEKNKDGDGSKNKVYKAMGIAR